MSYQEIASGNPYYDKFDFSKNYQRLLFVPGRALQSRELIELGTTSQNQLSELAKRVYEEGATVNGGAISVDFDREYMIVDDTDSEGNPVNLDNFVKENEEDPEKIIVDDDNPPARARVIDVDKENNAIYYEQLGGEFSLDKLSPAEIHLESDATVDAIMTSLGTALVASIDNGVVFVSDHFVKITDQQELIVDKFNSDGNYYIGFTIQEEVIESTDDNTLLDPANGATNYNAPGADRYKLTVKLDSIDAGTSPIPDDFFKLMEVNNGEIMQYQDDIPYSSISDELAKRRYEESGSYVVEQFPIKLMEHPDDASKIRIGLEDGLAYIFGYRIEKDNTSYLDVNKSRTFDVKEQEQVYIDFGPSVDIDEFYGGLFENNEIIRFYSNSDANGTELGTGRFVTLVRNNESSYRFHFFDADTISEKFDSVASLKGDSSGAVANVTIEDDGNPELHDRNDKEMIFELKKDTIKKVQSGKTQYKATKQFLQVTKNTNDQYELNTNNTNVSFLTNGIVAIVDNNGNFIPRDSFSSSFGSGGSDDSVLIITIDSNSISPLPDSIDVIVEVAKTSLDPRTKLLETATETETSGSQSIDGADEITLNNTDIFRLISITDNDSGNSVNLDSVTLDNGQRDYIYDYGRIKGLNSNTNYTIEYEYFSHDNNRESDFFSANSYPDSLYDQIPNYEGSNSDYSLRNSLDFRVAVDDFSFNSRDKPLMKDQLSLYFEYYLSRKDKLFLDKNGNFGIKEGVPKENPNFPKDKDNSETLYELNVPPYTFYPGEIDVEDKQNYNYTMIEIGELDKRVKQLEYYSSLNQLERESKDTPIRDRDGIDKSKQGILTDDFSGHAVSDVNHPEYNCSIDKGEQILRPPHKKQHYDFVSDSGHSNVVEHKHIVTLDYSIQSFIKQLYATEAISVTPLQTGVYSGSVTLEPRTDNWIDTQNRPDTQVNLGGQNNNWELLSESLSNMDAFETQWNDWQTQWTGRNTSQRTNSWTNTNTRNGDFDNDGFVNDRLVTTTQTDRTVTTTTRNERQRRSGQRITGINSEQIERRVDDRVTDVSIVPFMRSREIQFTAVGMKPNTELKAYFDNEDVTQYCSPQGGSNNDPLVTDGDGELIGTFTIPNNDTQRFRTGTKVFELKDKEDNPSTSADSRYTARGLLQRKQGTVFSTTVPDISTDTETQTRTTSEVVDRDVNINRTRDTQFFDWGGSRVNTDPIAQTFRINSDTSGVFLKKVTLYFEDKPDVSNGGKSTPVRVQIVDTSNGYPSSKIVPRSEASKKPSEVNVSSDSSAGTTFEFEDPIYLEGGEEYALVVLSNDLNYRIWTAVRGEKDKITNELIAHQPHLGSFFKSQNKRVWTTDQNRDLKFEFERCEFSDSPGQFYMTNEHIPNPPVEISTMMIDVEEMEEEDSSISYEYNVENDSSKSWLPVENKENVYFNEEYIIDNTDRLKLRANISTNNTKVSPVIDKERSSFFAIKNKIVESNDSSLNDAGTYVSRRASLINPADDMRVYLNVAKPGVSDVKLYYNTGTHVPRYTVIDNDNYSKSLIDEKIDIYWEHNGNVSGFSNNEFEFRGTAVVTRVKTEESVSPTEERVFLKSVSNTDAFENPSNDYSNIYMVVDNSTIQGEIVESWDPNVTYSNGSHVWHNNILWRSEKNDNKGNEPSNSSRNWAEIPHGKIISQIFDNTEAQWQEMEVVNSPDAKVNTDNFNEYTFKPVEIIGDEFNNYRIKIEMKSGNKVDMPEIQALRVVAAI